MKTLSLKLALLVGLFALPALAQPRPCFIGQSCNLSRLRVNTGVLQSGTSPFNFTAAGGNAVQVDSAGNLFPQTNNTQVLGAAAFAWNTFYSCNLTNPCGGSNAFHCNGAATCGFASASGQTAEVDCGGGTCSVNIGDVNATNVNLGRSGQSLTLNGNVGTVGNIAATGTGVTAVRSTPAILTGQTATVGSIGSITSPNDGNKHVYCFGGAIKVTAYTSGTVELAVAFTDHTGAAQSLNTSLVSPSSGVPVIGATATGYWAAAPMCFTVNPNTTVTTKTVAVFVATYDVEAFIQQVM